MCDIGAWSVELKVKIGGTENYQPVARPSQWLKQSGHRKRLISRSNRVSRSRVETVASCRVGCFPARHFNNLTAPAVPHHPTSTLSPLHARYCFHNLPRDCIRIQRRLLSTACLFNAVVMARIYPMMAENSRCTRSRRKVRLCRVSLRARQAG